MSGEHTRIEGDRSALPVTHAGAALHAPPATDAMTTPAQFQEGLDKATASGSVIQIAAVLIEYGSHLVHMGSPIEALEHLGRAETLLDSTEPESIPPQLHALLYVQKGLALGFCSRFDEAWTAHSQALAIADRANLEVLKFRSRINVGYSDLQRGDTAAAMHAYQMALSSRDPEHPVYGLGLIVLADLFIEMGALEAAERQINEAVLYLSPKWIQTGQHRIRLALARIRGRTGDAGQAETLLEIAQTEDDLTDNTGRALTQLAVADLALFNLEIDKLHRCCDLTEEMAAGTWFPKTAKVMLVEALVETGDHVAADACADQLVVDELPFLIRHRLLEARRKLSIERGDWESAYRFLEQTRPNVPQGSRSQVRQSQNTLSYPLSRNLSNVVDISAKYQALRRNVEIAQTAAHDLRTPFQSSALLIDLLRSQIGPQFDESFDILAGELERANSIVDEMNRLTGGDLVAEPRPAPPIRCVAAVQAAISRIKPILDGKEQTADFVDVTTGAEVMMDRHLLEQVLDNLLSNASKYSEPGTHIVITLSDGPNGHVDLAVSDQGLGFTAGDIADAFGYRRTLSARPTGSESASGLGLYITKQVVEGAGGTVAITSPGPGKGSTVVVSLPADEAPVT